MRTRAATLAVALSTTLLGTGAAVAHAAPTVVDVRVEGKTDTLFEGPLLTDGHDIQASSDTQARHCDATNNHPAGTPPAPTPTAAAVDAMVVAGQASPFDAQWYPGFEDYFVQRFGPDMEDPDTYAYWGILVDGSFTDVGGCQYALVAGDQVLWVYDAFGSPQRTFLRLAAAGDPNTLPAAPQPTATVSPNQSLTVAVTHYSGAMDGAAQDAGPGAGVAIAPVTTAANGFETADAGAPLATTDAGGTATVTFATAGWHRLKATDDADYVRSNRLDVCVTPCGAPPADTEVRSAPGTSGDGGGGGDGDGGGSGGNGGGTGGNGGGDGGAGGDGGGSGTPAPPAGALRLSAPRFGTAGVRRGRVAVSWRVLARGPGVRGWTLASRVLGTSRWITRATGTTATSAQLALPAGVVSEVRLTIIDGRGASATTMVGRTVVPRDDRAAGLRLHGGWRRTRAAGAWLGTVTRGRAGATAGVRLAAGRPTFVVRTGRGAAAVELRGGGRRTVLRIAGTRTPTTRLLTSPRRARAGDVVLRVVKGSVDLDGVAVQP